MLERYLEERAKEVQDIMMTLFRQEEATKRYGNEREEKGRKVGREEGEGKLGRLMDILLRDGKTKEAQAAATNSDRRQQLYIQYGIF